MKATFTPWLLASFCFAGDIQAQSLPVPTVTIIHPTCTVLTGSITVTSPTGPNFAYSLNNSAFQSNPVFSDLYPYSIYCIRVKDNNGTYYEPVCVELIKPLRPRTPSVITSQPDCGDVSGAIFVMHPLGNEYVYSINNTDYQSSTTFNNVPPGQYFVSVKNVNLGCSSKKSEVYIYDPPNDCHPAGIFHTSVSCSDYEDDPYGQLIEQFCYRSRAGKVTNATPGKFFYFTLLAAPSESFCVDILQTKSNNELALFSIHQGNQVTLYDADCSKVATGTQVSLGQGRICIDDAIPGAQYVLSVKYDSKSVIGSTFTGSPPTYQYIFESKIQDTTVSNSVATINMVPNCSSRIDEVPAMDMKVTLAPNPSSSTFELHIGSLSKENITINITDANGRRLKQLQSEYSENIRLGNELSAGLYFIEVIQGEQRTLLRALRM